MISKKYSRELYTGVVARTKSNCSIKGLQLDNNLEGNDSSAINYRSTIAKGLKLS